MRTMYREEVSRRKLPSILAFFILLVPLIYVADIAEQIAMHNRAIGIVANSLLFAVTLGILGYAIIRCRTRYRYSIIADQLIIHRLNNGDQVVVENIKIKDIKSIDKKGDLSCKLRLNHTYNCSLLKPWTCCCTYKDNDKYRRFYFQPSDNFINKLQFMIQNENKYAS
jgi:hypothetical protein